MLCWSCQKPIPETAKICPHCEAEVMEELTAEEIDIAKKLLSGMDDDLLQQLKGAFDSSTSGEDFVNQIMVGTCPQCDSSDTADCEADPDLEDPCIGRCFACGQLWCLDCGELFEQAKTIEHDCPAWADIDLDKLDEDLDEDLDESDF